MIICQNFNYFANITYEQTPKKLSKILKQSKVLLNSNKMDGLVQIIQKIYS